METSGHPSNPGFPQTQILEICTSMKGQGSRDFRPTSSHAICLLEVQTNFMLRRGVNLRYENCMSNSYWLVKQEPSSYAWSTFVKDKRTDWTGVRNYQARNNLRAMKKGDLVFYYHSGDEKQAVGIAKVTKGPYADPTATEGDWTAVDLVPVKPLKQPVTLSTIKADAILKEMLLARNSRLSVSPVSEKQFQRLLKLAETQI